MTGCHLILAHLLGDRTYRDFYRQATGWKILDNGAAEGELVAPDELIRLATDIRANEIVVPDELGDSFVTIMRARQFKEIADLHPEFRYMGVVQGRNDKERRGCLTIMQHLGYMNVYALPRVMTLHDTHARIAFAASCYADNVRPSFHCLGSGHWCEEIKALANLPMIRSADTAMPIKMGLRSQELVHDAWYDADAHTKDYFTRTPYTHERRIIDSNIRTYLDWASASLGGM